MTTSAKEVIARALPDALKAADEFATVAASDPHNATVDGIFDLPSAATAILAALEAAGYVVVERAAIDALVAALEKAKDWMISCDAPTWGRMEIEEADAALALARKEG